VAPHQFLDERGVFFEMLPAKGKRAFWFCHSVILSLLFYSGGIRPVFPRRKSLAPQEMPCSILETKQQPPRPGLRKGNL
ncbi:hypothetical protein MR547_05005, partial [bacterium]|nr:hypothetical protein [bacterium]